MENRMLGFVCGWLAGAIASAGVSNLVIRYCLNNSYRDAQPIVKDITKDGLADVVLKGEDGKTLQTYVQLADSNEPNNPRYQPLKQYLEQQEVKQRESYSEYLGN